MFLWLSEAICRTKGVLLLPSMDPRMLALFSASPSGVVAPAVAVAGGAAPGVAGPHIAGPVGPDVIDLVDDDAMPDRDALMLQLVVAGQDLALLRRRARTEKAREAAIQAKRRRLDSTKAQFSRNLCAGGSCVRVCGLYFSASPT